MSRRPAGDTSPASRWIPPGAEGGPTAARPGTIYDVLKTDAELEASTVVANNAMNRERGLAGVNSYQRALGFDPYGFLRGRLAERGRASWLDLCCGEGNALIEAAGRLAAEGVAGFSVVGVDLVGRISGHRPLLPAGLELVAASVASWSPPAAFDLVTCVHGLHYVGDKLGLLARAARWLTDDGLFVADFDPASIRAADGRPSARRATRALRQAGAEYDGRRHRVTWQGRIPLDFPGARYLGADDAAGPAYTGQPAVSSYYDWPPHAC